MNAQAGDLLKVSDFVNHGTVDGTWSVGTAAYDKRGVASFVPAWTPDNCIQCNKCAFVCPHACIRPFVLDEAEKAGFNEPTLDILAPKDLKGMQFRIEVSVLDCTGCGNCADVCPGKKGNKALAMTQFVAGEEEATRRAADWNYKNVKSKQNLVDIKSNAKNSQFAQPLFEFSGACAGCGETPYVKLVSQLFGDREMIANATGCSSIYSASVPLQQMRKVTVLHSTTHCSRTSASSVWVWQWVTRRCASVSSYSLTVLWLMITYLQSSRKLLRSGSTT